MVRDLLASIAEHPIAAVGFAIFALLALDIIGAAAVNIFRARR